MSKKNSSYFLLKKSEPQKFSQLQPEPHHSLRYKKKDNAKNRPRGGKETSRDR